MRRLSLRGILLAIAAGCCWGSMSVAAQYLFTQLNFASEDLTALRLLGSGVLLLSLSALIGRKNVFSSLKDAANRRGLFIYGLGLLAVQYTFFLAIEASNAGTAAIMVGFGPLFIIAYYVVFKNRKPGLRELICLALAMVGIYLIITKGKFDSAEFSVLGVFWGLMSAASGAFCTIQPRPLLARIGVTEVVGWGMLVGGIIGCLVTNPISMQATWTWSAVAGYAYIVVFGTIIAFWCYLRSTELIPPSITAILGSFEPLSAVVLSVILLGSSFNGWELLGAAAILVNTAILALAPEQKTPA